MKFGIVPLDAALGAILAHSETLGQGRIRKGKFLDQNDIDRLRAGGFTEVTVAQPESGDVHEDLAATRLAAALVPDPAAGFVRVSVAATGRVNLFAATAGIAGIDAAKINALNHIDPMITVATVPEWQRMDPGAMLATVKIISYAVPEQALQQACEIGGGSIRMRPPAVSTADLIQSVVSKDDGSKGYRVIGARLEKLNVALGEKIVVPHEVDAMAQALARSKADILFILTGSATSDIRDTAPEALRRAGGRVDHYGMPVDPGNLLFFGELGGRPVIGLPGCARSPALNGADWVMERFICGEPLTSRDISDLGVGGLLKEIPLRGRLREG